MVFIRSPYFFHLHIYAFPAVCRLRLFIEKLTQKKQTSGQLKQAAHAVYLFFESQAAETKAVTTTPLAHGNHNSPYPPLVLRGGGEAGGVIVKGEYYTATQYRATTGGLPLQGAKAATSPPANSDIRTTMIYTHCIPGRNVKETKSPLDF